MTMTSRAFLIHMMALFMLSICITGNCLAQNDEKPTYKFTDNRISLADTLLSHKDYTRALEAYKVALETYKTESFYEGMVYATERMAFCYRRLKNDGLSAETFQQAIDLAKEKLEPNHMLLSKAYLNNGIRAHYHEHYQSASYLLDSAMWVYKQNGDDIELMVYNDIVRFKFYTYYYSNISSDTLIKYALEKRALFHSEINNIPDEILTIADLARAFYRKKDYYSSMAYGMKAVNLAKNHLADIPPFYYEDALFVLGNSLKSLEKFDQALAVTNELLDYSTRHNPDSDSFLGRLNLKAVILVSLKRFEEARKIYSQILVLSKKYDIRRDFLISVIMNIGASYTEEGKFREALPYLLEALKLQKKSPGASILMISAKHQYLANAYNLDSQYDKAIQHYDSAINFLKPSSAPKTSEASNLEKTTSLNLLYLFQAKTKTFKNLYYQKGEKNHFILDSILNYTERTHESLIRNRLNIDTDNTKLTLSKNFKGLYEMGTYASFLMFQKTPNPMLITTAIKNICNGKSLLFLEQFEEFSSSGSEVLSYSLRQQFSDAKKKCLRQPG